MKTAAILLATLGLTVAGVAAASERLSDVDYLKANRCRGLAAGMGVTDTASLAAHRLGAANYRKPTRGRGLAAGMGVTDTASLDALIKAEGRSRIEVVYQ